jgi:hypothetical protein
VRTAQSRYSAEHSSFHVTNCEELRGARVSDYGRYCLVTVNKVINLCLHFDTLLGLHDTVS